MQRSNSMVGVGLSFTSMAVLYSVMLVGVYISSSHQGLTCPDWPLCPNGFGLPSETHFYEHYHRVLVLVTAGLIYATAVYSVRKALPGRKTAIIASIVMSVQIAIGFFVIDTGLHPIIVATHLSTGILLFAMTLMTFLSLYWHSRKKSQQSTTL
ncbi:MAG TPA: COX15/CtaA family protein [Nitrososphaera sp.]|nr:COX15/CtaA family protein [Nitrososphaera sp.]